VDGERSKRKKTAAAAKETRIPFPHEREPVTPQPREKRVAGIDDELREYMREWRRKIAQQQGVPAYIVLHDASLDEICRRRPSSLAALLQISGVGERKAELYGRQIFAALAKFDAGDRASAAVETKPTPAAETMRLLAEGRSFAEIAQIRDRQLATVVGLVADLVEKDRLEFDDAWVSAQNRALIEEACGRLGLQWLRPIQEAVPGGVSFEDVRLVVADLRRKRAETSPD
jgi:ATP-dependent DNA helicase RecQ